ncbi:MAG TPA: ATP-binding cassette domain-containing protein [Thermoanaerobaculia bacterium]|jgi:molybdate transport system ATP-binding protein|nr:ATP-binding cassette domain-containing protein [Thermoanaerobaculia bacterium]
MKISLDGVRLPLAEFELVLTVELTAPLVGIVGPSGAGKTSLLDLIAGLRRPAAGRLAFDGELVDDVAARLHVPPRHRRIGYVPQDNALFPHLSVEQNIRYGTRGPLQADILDLLEINTLLPRRVTSLSGGEQKRIALARALMSSPRLLLLDEPLAGIDRPLQSRIRGYLEELHNELSVPMLYVTHDREELVRMAGQTIELNRGRLHGVIICVAPAASETTRPWDD